MNNFDLRKYLKNNPLLKEEAPQFQGGNTFIENNPYFEAGEIPQGIDHFEISTLLQAIGEANTTEEFYYILFPDADDSPSEEIEQFFSYHKPNFQSKEDIVVDIDLMMGADADKIPAQGKISFGEFVSLFDKYWRTTGAEGGDVDFISQGLENHVDAGMLTDEEADEAIDYFFEN